MMEWRHVLEIGNGLWTIVSAYLSVFLAYHLLIVTIQRKLWNYRWLDLPLSVQLAVGTWVASAGVMVTRFVVFGNRLSNEGNITFSDADTIIFAIGVVIGLAGFLCILRVATKPMLGRWPWVSCMICCAFYVLWEVVRVT